MKKLKELVEACRFKVIHGGKCPILEKVKNGYKSNFGIVSKHPHQYRGTMSHQRGIEIADAYTNLEHSPDDFLVKTCYDKLGEEVIAQFKFLNQKEKIIYEPFEGKGEPYKNSFEMLKDFHNSHLYFFKTEAGFGEENSSLQNKMLEKTGFLCGDYELMVNDVFRIIHDIFGHAMNGYGFGAIGEDQAWFTHMQMFTPLAAAALTTETRGQNCWVNFGSHMRNNLGEINQKDDPGFLFPQDRPFAEQKMGLLSPHISGIEVWELNHQPYARFVDNWAPLRTLSDNF